MDTVKLPDDVDTVFAVLIIGGIGVEYIITVVEVIVEFPNEFFAIKYTVYEFDGLLYRLNVLVAYDTSITKFVLMYAFMLPD